MLTAAQLNSHENHKTLLHDERIFGANTMQIAVV